MYLFLKAHSLCKILLRGEAVFTDNRCPPKNVIKHEINERRQAIMENRAGIAANKAKIG